MKLTYHYLDEHDVVRSFEGAEVSRQDALRTVAELGSIVAQGGLLNFDVAGAFSFAIPVGRLLIVRRGE